MNQPDTNPDAVKEKLRKHEPPTSWVIRFCPVCGQNSFVRPLSPRHYSGGRQCGGTVKDVTYLRKDNSHD